MMQNRLRVKDKGNSFYKDRQDFLVRRFGFSSLQVIQFMTITLMVIIAATFFLYRIYRDMAGLNYDSGDHTWILSGCLTAIVVGFVLQVYVRQIKLHKDAIDATEFLNALFASIVSNGYRFSMIVSQEEGQVFYVDREFQTTFPDIVTSAGLTLDGFLAGHGVEGADYTPLLQSVRNGTVRQVTVQMKCTEEKKPKTLAISVELIKRPTGFCLLRGKDA